MKTCPNPKCKMTGIPDDAKFCPKCGEPFMSPEEIEQHDLKILCEAAEKAWEAYPDKPQPKKNPYSIWWKIVLVVDIIYGIVMYNFLMNRYGYTHEVVPGEVEAAWKWPAYILIYLLIFLIYKSISFNPNQDIESKKEKFITNYLSSHKKG